MAETIIQTRNIFQSYGENIVLEDISLDILKGKLTAFTGLSGCGKTVLLKLMAGLIEPDRGSVYIRGVDLFNLPRRKLLEMRKEIGFIFQGGAILSNLNVFDNIALPLGYHHDLTREEVEERVLALLRDFRLTSFRNMLPGHLSIGQRKLLGVARALVMNPSIIFTDEPMGVMDAIVKEHLLKVLVKLRDDPQITLVVATHDIEFIKKYADFIGILDDRKLIAYGERDDILKSMDPVLHGILAMVVDETEMIAEDVLGIMTGDAIE
jgi:phospholipid/cholesterol/gamma-HCH transport system ATP-binding protein